ncbi:hypothetical protein ANCCEY_11867 [Ancylostoma ceylanicum]|uniref:SCP domain-containing protein n=1 Tax=Ancylostoma ceylanicum TaxID=53326 RepID=A0A0D6LAJ0_9BILA|nr:hypothetical protein ANCCEY_11867 [Ancylostoma ceylanicum]
MLKIAVLVLCISWSLADNKPCNDRISDDIRQKIVKHMNDRRSELANGQVNGASGKLKAAKFMNKLEWDCSLEEEAARRCSNGRIDTNALYQMGPASTIVIGPGCYPKPLHFNDFKKAMVEWWDEAKSYSDNRFTDRTRPNFPQVSFALKQKNFSLKDTEVANKDLYELCMYIL